jgi:hypothetical protein
VIQRQRNGICGWKRGKKGLLLFLLAVALTGPSGARAHHILGLPHYAYDERYPQTPVLTYKANAGPNELKMTGYPGVPRPGQRCTIHIYIRNIESGELFDGKVTLTVMRDRMIGADPVVYGPLESGLEMSLYKFSPQFEHEGNYTLRLEYEADEEPWVIDLPLVVGEPGSPWTVVGSTAGGLAIFLILIRAVRIKRKRRKQMHQNDSELSPAGGRMR